MLLKQHIDHLIQASAAAEAEDRELAIEYGIDTTLGTNILDPKSIDFAFADRPKETEIISYLNELDHNTLLWLETLLYLGRRDDDSNVYSIHSHLSSMNESKEEIIRSIVEKRGAFARYYIMAINVLRQENIDIDSLQ